MKNDLASLRLGLRPADVADVLGSEQLFREMVAARWIEPVIDRHKLKLYDRGHIASAWARILAGEQPPRIGSDSAV